jgi:hypothetical protein
LSRTLGFADTIRRAFDVEPFRSAGVGPMSYYFDQVFGVDDTCQILRFESLRSELYGYLVQLGLSIPRCLDRAIVSEVPINSSPRSLYRHYYDPRLAEEIGRRDAGLIQRFGYRYEADSSPTR